MEDAVSFAKLILPDKLRQYVVRCFDTICCLFFGVWEIQPRDEAALDRYEGYPNLYRKEDIQVTMSDGTEVTAMVYIMNRGLPDYPNASYYRTIEEGYHDCGLDPQYLKGALEDTEMRKKKQ